METCHDVWKTTVQWLNTKTHDLSAYTQVAAFFQTDDYLSMDAKINDALRLEDVKQLKTLCGSYCRAYLAFLKK